MSVYREEVFGPVLAVQTFTTFEEAVALADHPTFGLAASVHTADINKALAAARQIQAGTVWINDWGRRSDFTSPFGGYKQSGHGKDMGLAGFEAQGEGGLDFGSTAAIVGLVCRDMSRHGGRILVGIVTIKNTMQVG